MPQPPEAAASPPADRPEAFILAGSFLVVCRSPRYVAEIRRRGLRALLITPAGARDRVRQAAADPGHPAALFDDIAFVDGDVGRDTPYLADAVAAARRWRESYRLVGAYPVGETQVEPTGVLADALGFRSPGLRATRVCRNKFLQRWYLPGISPRSVAVPPAGRESWDAAGTTFPAVVKPTGRHSSAGVVTVRDEAELRTRLGTYPPGETVLVEERVDGPECSVESLVQHGRVVFASVTRKRTNDRYSDAFVELAHTVAAVPGEEDRVLLAANERMLAELGFEDGISHAEWRIDPAGRPVLMEVAARPPGDGICELYHLVTGAPLEPEVIRIALGERSDYPRPFRYARQVYLEAGPGVLRDVLVDWPGVSPCWVGEDGLWPEIGPAAPADPPTVRAVLVHKHRGDLLGPLRSSDDRVVSLFLDAPGPAELDELERRARQAVTVRVDPPDPAALDTVTHVLVGYSPVMLRELDALVPPASVLVVEEPDVIGARGIADLPDRHRCVAALLPAPSQDERWPQRLRELVPRPPGVRVVVPVVEYGVVTAAALAEAWGLPGAGYKAARVLRDKALLRETVATTDIAQPAWEVAHGPEHVAGFRDRHRGWCVVKPAGRQASVGVQLLGPGDDPQEAWAHATGADEPLLRARYATDDRILVEERLRGPEVSVEALVHEGLVVFSNVTRKDLLDSRYPVETGHTLPADLPESTVAALRDAVQTLVTATSFRSGVLHAEWILAGDRPWLVECAARLPGDGITVLIDLAYDTNILREFLTVLAGRPPTLSGPAVRGAAVRFLTVPAGEVVAVDGVEVARALPGMHEVHLNVAPGDTVAGVTNSWERAGLVIAVGDDGAEAATRAAQAVSTVTVRVRDGAGSTDPDPAAEDATSRGSADGYPADRGSVDGDPADGGAA